MRRRSFLQAWILLGCLLAACASQATAPAETELVDVYASSAAQPWLTDLYPCTLPGLVVRVVSRPSEADLVLRLGEPDLFTGQAYQVGSEQVLVVVHRQSPVQNLTAVEVRDLFAGLGDPTLQLWVYAAGEDVQAYFSKHVMQGRPLSSQARMATSPGHMSEVVLETPQAVGILPRYWEAGDMRVVYTLPDAPVLALLPAEPQGGLRALLACLQK